MCKIKTGNQITEMHDIQNLITAYILRSKQPYSISSLTNQVMIACRGSKLPITEYQIKTMVQDTTIALLRTKYISSNSGNYFVKHTY
jgi:hypothetical protein